MLIKKLIESLKITRFGKPLTYSKSYKKHRDRYKLDYDYFSNVPEDMRDDQLDRIRFAKKTNQQFSREFPKFPNQQVWDYHGLKLMTYFWQPKNKKEKAIAIFFHGLNGHTNLWGDMASNLAGEGFICAGYDYKNFGQSESPVRGCFESLSQTVKISHQFIIRVKSKYPNLKVYVIGMSLGGTITFNMANEYPKIIDGAILLNPSLRLNKMHLPFIKKLAFLASLVLPNIRLLKQSGRNSSKYLFDQYIKKDPFLYHGRLHLATIRQMILSISRVRYGFKKFGVPYLFVQGGKDKLVDPFACFDLQKQSPSHDKTTVFISEMWHAIWFDNHMPEVNKIVIEWLKERI